MKLITRDTDYAMRSLCYLASKPQTVVSVSELTNKLHISRPFLRKILQVLTRENLLRSIKGVGGGFVLRKSPQDITLMRVMQIFQNDFEISECSLNKMRCPNIKSCGLRKKLKEIEDSVRSNVENISLASLLDTKRKD